MEDYLSKTRITGVQGTVRKVGRSQEKENVYAAKGAKSEHVFRVVEGVMAKAVYKSEIFMPSPMRLLRLVNGVKCELCRKQSVADRSCGMVLCSECTEIVLIRPNGMALRSRLRSPLSHPSGEYIGPILLCENHQGQAQHATERELRFLHEHNRRIVWADGTARKLRQFYDANIRMSILLVMLEIQSRSSKQSLLALVSVNQLCFS